MWTWRDAINETPDTPLIARARKAVRDYDKRVSVRRGALIEELRKAACAVDGEVLFAAETDSSDIRHAQTQLGHASVTTTEHYVRRRRGDFTTPTK